MPVLKSFLQFFKFLLIPNLFNFMLKITFIPKCEFSWKNHNFVTVKSRKSRKFLNFWKLHNLKPKASKDFFKVQRNQLSLHVLKMSLKPLLNFHFFELSFSNQMLLTRLKIITANANQVVTWKCCTAKFASSKNVIEIEKSLHKCNKWIT